MATYLAIVDRYGLHTFSSEKEALAYIMLSEFGSIRPTVDNQPDKLYGSIAQDTVDSNLHTTNVKW